MAYYILTEACICCGSCAAVCPIDAIQEGTDAYEITDDCIECGTCVPMCPCENIQEISHAGAPKAASKETKNMMVMPQSLPNKNMNQKK